MRKRFYLGLDIMICISVGLFFSSQTHKVRFLHVFVLSSGEKMISLRHKRDTSDTSETPCDSRGKFTDGCRKGEKEDECLSLREISSFPTILSLVYFQAMAFQMTTCVSVRFFSQIVVKTVTVRHTNTCIVCLPDASLLSLRLSHSLHLDYAPSCGHFHAAAGAKTTPPLFFLLVFCIFCCIFFFFNTTQLTNKKQKHPFLPCHRCCRVACFFSPKDHTTGIGRRQVHK